MPFKHKKALILDVPFSCCSFEEILLSIDRGINQRYKGYLSITNTESLYHALRIPSHFQYISNATFSCCDGVAVVLSGKMLGHNIPRLHGPDLMLRCCKFGVNKGWRHFFYGGKKGVAELLSHKLTAKFSGLITAGCCSPPFRPLKREEDRAVIEMINDSNPDILWVGLGLLKQEQWIADHLKKINSPWMVGVGAAFDFHADTIKRAPKFYQDIGLEWLYRLAFEPRMLIRNLYSFLVFLSVIKNALRQN